jgi:hypothetical protein
MRIWAFLSAFVIALFVAVIILFYPYVFSRNIYGEMLSVERVGPQTVLSDNKSLSFSFAVAIKEETSGVILTASSEDRQWGAWEKLTEAKSKKYCVQARLFPYPPWNLVKAGTYHDARLLKVEECK